MIPNQVTFFDQNEVPDKLEIYNIENIENITFVRNWQPTVITASIIHNVEIYGIYAIVAHYSSGVRILDISVPVNPEEVASYGTRQQVNSKMYEGCWAMYLFPYGKISTSDILNGLFVVRSAGLTNINNIIN